MRGRFILCVAPSPQDAVANFQLGHRDRWITKWDDKIRCALYDNRVPSDPLDEFRSSVLTPLSEERPEWLELDHLQCLVISWDIQL